MCSRGWSLEVALIIHAHRVAEVLAATRADFHMLCMELVATELLSILILRRPAKDSLHQSNASTDILHIAAEQCAIRHGDTLRRLQRSRLEIQVPDLRAEILLHQMLQTTQSSARSRSATKPAKGSWKCTSQARPSGNDPAYCEARHVDSCFRSRVQASVDALPNSARATWGNVCADSGTWTG